MKKENSLKILLYSIFLTSCLLSPLSGCFADPGTGEKEPAAPEKEAFAPNPDRKHPPHRPNRHLDKIANELGLTDEQTQQMKENMRGNLQTSGCLDKTDPVEKRNCMRELRNNSRRDFIKTLTPEQQTKLAELRKSKQGHQLENMAKELDFTEAQQTDMREFTESLRKECQTGSQGENLEACMAKNRGKVRAHMRSILTDEQKSKFNALKHLAPPMPMPMQQNMQKGHPQQIPDGKPLQTPQQIPPTAPQGKE